MNANLAASTAAEDRLAGELAELAYPVALKRGVEGFSIDVELEIWEAIRAALPTTTAATPAPEDVLARAADAAYRVALRRGFRGAFLDLELGLWHAVHGRR